MTMDFFMLPTLAASNGDDLLTTSSSPFAPNGVSKSSQNAIQGGLTWYSTIVGRGGLRRCFAYWRCW